MSSAAQLIEIVKQTQTIRHAFLDGFPEPERSADGTFEHWSPKDLIAHFTSWQARLHERFVALREGRTAAPIEDDDKENAASYPENQHRPLAEIVAQADKTTSLIVADIEAYDEEQLTKSSLIPTDRRTVWQAVIGSVLLHPQTHYADFWMERGDLARAEAVHLHTNELLSKADDVPALGVSTYNLACFYARSGQTEKALNSLAEGLRMAPFLVEWSRKDPDLVSLHEQSEYQALTR